MGMADLRGRRGGVAAAVAAFWLGFVCGGGSLPGAAVIGGASGQPPQEPASASQSPQGPAPASQPPQEP
ncbi:MAG: leucyl aminopeptidase, partial [Acidobacteria bacterium]|nr:leucyl aminopeptidase [Acidobacteriota bacterium]